MIEGILRKIGYVEPKEIKKIKFPVKIFWRRGNDIFFLAIPFKELFALEILKNLQEYFKIYGVIRGAKLDLERFSFEEKDYFEAVAWIEKEKVLEMREYFNRNLKKSILFGKISLLILNYIEKIYLVVDSLETYEKIFDLVKRSKKIIICDVQRNIEKALEYCREVELNYVVYVDNLMLKEGKCLFFDERGRKRVRNIEEVI